MKTLVYTALKIFTEQIKKPLTRILFFRDGVSEGEYDEVRKRELTAIEGAYSFQLLFFPASGCL